MGDRDDTGVNRDVRLYGVGESGALGSGYHLLRVQATDPGCLLPPKLAACVADLVSRGVPDDPPGAGEATAYCSATYRLLPVSFDEGITLQIGAVPAPSTAGCP